jgi:hypothetical protein
MRKRHLVIPALLLAGSALFGVQALLGAIPLGPDPSNPAVATSQERTATEDQITARSTQLDELANRLDELDAQRPPALPSTSTAADIDFVAAAARVSSPQLLPAVDQHDEHARGDDDHDDDHDDDDEDDHEDDDHHSDREHHDDDD